MSDLKDAARLAKMVGATGWDAAAIRTLAESPGGVLIVWPGEGFVLGRVALDEAELFLIAVEPARRRQGLGVRLLQRFEVDVLSRGARSVFLEVAASNEAARALYAAQGYEEMGRRTGYYASGDDAITLTHTIAPSSNT